MGCETCDDERVLSYYGECCLCADCSDDLKLYDYITELKQKLKIATDALEFYGDINNWGSDGNLCHIDFIDIENLQPNKSEPFILSGGLKARKTLENLRGENEC